MFQISFWLTLIIMQNVIANYLTETNVQKLCDILFDLREHCYTLNKSFLY